MSFRALLITLSETKFDDNLDFKSRKKATFFPQINVPHGGHPPFHQGGLSLQPSCQKGGFTGPQLLDGGCWERGGDFFRGGGVAIN